MRASTSCLLSVDVRRKSRTRFAVDSSDASLSLSLDKSAMSRHTRELFDTENESRREPLERLTAESLRRDTLRRLRLGCPGLEPLSHESAAKRITDAPLARRELHARKRWV